VSPTSLRQILIRSLTAVACCVVLLLACAPGSAPAPSTSAQGGGTPVVPAGLSGRLLMTRDLGLWTLDLATSRLTQVAKPPEMGQILTGRWSPDGTRIAYALFEVRDRRTPASAVVVVGADGSNPRAVLNTEGAGMFFQSPVWDRDGQHLFVLHIAQTGEERVRRIARVNVETSELTTVTEEIGQFDISPDGRWLALIRAATGPGGILLIDVQNGEQRVLVPDRQYETITALRFDPRGEKIIFSAAPQIFGGRDEPALPELARRLLGLPAIALAHGPPQDIFTVPVAGGTATRMLPLQADEPVAAYSPDGANVAVLSIENLSLVQVASGARTQIMSPGGSGSIDWAR
jgi:Tol biopolymer transport system component